MWRVIAVFVMLGLLTVAADPASAISDFTVNSTVDAIDAIPGDGVCASAGGQCTLRAAVMETNALSGADTITLPAGTYTLSIPGRGEDYGSVSGDLDIVDDLTINGASAQLTTIDGSGIDRVIEVNGELDPDTETVNFAGLTIQNGLTDGFDSGGGLLVLYASVALNDVLVKDNAAPDEFNGGGGIFAGFASMILRESAVTDNLSGSGGGGIAAFPAALTVVDSSVSSNTAGGGGGGIMTGFTTSDSVILTGSVISQNHALDGGGVFNSGHQLSVTDSTIADNTADGIGGIHNLGGGLTLTRATVSGNASGGVAGGVGNTDGGSALLINATVSGNAAQGAGGVYNGSGSTLTLTSASVAGNQGSSGGGVWNDGGTVVLASSIVGNNTAVLSSPDCKGPLTSNGHNLIESVSDCAFSAAAGDITQQDPLIEFLAENGGPTRTHALSSGSPAIDAGDNVSCVATDQRGVSRPQGAACDIGAYELEQAAPPTPSPTPSQDVRDVDCDGDVTAVDALGNLVIVAGMNPLAQQEPCVDIGQPVADRMMGDTDCNEQITAVDTLLILRYVVKLSVTLPLGCEN